VEPLIHHLCSDFNRLWALASDSLRTWFCQLCSSITSHYNTLVTFSSSNLIQSCSNLTECLITSQSVNHPISRSIAWIFTNPTISYISNMNMYSLVSEVSEFTINMTIHMSSISTATLTQGWLSLVCWYRSNILYESSLPLVQDLHSL